MNRQHWKGRKHKAWLLLLIPLGIIAFSALVMALWNGVLVPVAHVGVVTLWQAMGLLVLSKILFGGIGPGRHRGHSGCRERKMWNSMTEEQRAQFRNQWHQYKHGWAAPGSDKPAAE